MHPHLSRRRVFGVSIVVAIAALTVAASSSAAPSVSVTQDTVNAKLEDLHARVVARTAAEEDNEYENGRAKFAHAITPERAATLAQQLARAQGIQAQQSYIELQTRNGRPVYAVSSGAASLFIDADNGTVVP
jgi:hypothetical protein